MGVRTSDIDAAAAGGDVSSTGSITADHLVSYDDTTGDVIEDSGVAKSDVRLVSTMGSGVNTFLNTPTAANLRTAMTGETSGSANLVFSNSPALITPTLGVPASGTLTNCTGRVNANQTADKIATSGTAVTISSTAPSAGQIITASSATAASWEDPTPGAMDDLTDVVDGTTAGTGLLISDGTRWIGRADVGSGPSSGSRLYLSSPTITASGTQNATPIYTLTTTPVVSTQQTFTVSAATTAALGAAFLYDTTVDLATFTGGFYSADLAAKVDAYTAGENARAISRFYSVLTQDGGAVTVTITGSGTSRTCTASGGTPFATSKINASGTATQASYVQTSSGIYQITARSSNTVVTIATPSGYTNQSTVAFKVWTLLQSTSITDGQSEIITATGSYLFHTAFEKIADVVLSTAHKLGYMVFGQTDTSTATITVSYDSSFESSSSHVALPFRIPGPANSLRSASTTINVSAATAPSSGQVLTATSSSTATWQAPAGGAPSGSAGGDLGGTYPNPTVAKITETSGPTTLTIGSIANSQILIRSGTTLIGTTLPTGDVTGPGSSTNGNVVIFNGTTGKAVQDSTLHYSGFAQVAGTDIGGSGSSPTVSATNARGLKSATTTVSVSGATAPSSGQALIATSSTAATWQNIIATVLRLTQNTSTSPAVNTLSKHSTTGGAVTVNLPSSHTAGDIIKVKMTSAATNTITIDPNSTQTIDGASTYVMVTDYECVTCESDGSNWLITG